MIKRSHKQNCSLAFAADILSERWTLLIVRELLLKPRRYGELLNNLLGMGTNLLATRLKELSELQIIEKQQSYYQLTSTGKALEPAVLGLIRWGLQFSDSLSDENYLHRPEWDLLALKSLFNPTKSQGLTLCVAFDLQGEMKHNQADQIDLKKAVAQAWVVIQSEQLTIHFDKPAPAVDVHWQKGITELASVSSDKVLINPNEANALKQFLSAFDPIG